MADVFKNFVAQKPNSRQGGAVSWKSHGRSVIFCEGDTVYSYGYHFPLAKRIGEVKNDKGEIQPVFVENGDRYSNTTSGHQSDTQKACQGPTVSRVNLEAAGIHFESLTLKDKRKPINADESDDPRAAILYWRADSREFVYWDKRAKKYFKDIYPVKKREEFVPPKQGMFMPYKNGDEAKVNGVWHILGAAVIERDKKYYLCALDGGAYFVSELPRKPKSIEDAFECLKPTEVCKAEKEGKQVLRQGEWFFVETGLDDVGMAAKFDYASKTAFLKDVAVVVLPRQDDRSNKHELSRGWSCTGKTKVKHFARGKVFHRSAWSSQLTRDHETVALGDKWYEVYHNTEVRSWSQDGRFD